jgi:hypothetical protein
LLVLCPAVSPQVFGITREPPGSHRLRVVP